jgi:hypothetical protein
VAECDWCCGSRRADFATSFHVGSDFLGDSCNDHLVDLLCIHLPLHVHRDLYRENRVDLPARHSWEIRALAVGHSPGRAALGLCHQQSADAVHQILLSAAASVVASDQIFVVE